MPIDMRSDTVTRPTTAMRRAMADAEVGDDVLDGDPTVRRLEHRVAELLGHERALFFPTGSMANQVALALHARPGDEILVDPGAHVLDWEVGASAALHGIQLRPVRIEGNFVEPADLARALRAPSFGAPEIAAVSLENTHNGAGGRVTPPAAMRELSSIARAARLRVHLDGARLWNAAESSRAPISDLARAADTVMVSFSKGLGAPVGAALAGPGDAIDRARVLRKRMGGGMRQSGILAAAALHALDHHLERLRDDHDRARHFASVVASVSGARVVPPDTNIVMVDLPSGASSAEVVRHAAMSGVLVSVWNPTRIRAVTHLDVGDDDVAEAARVVAAAIEQAASSEVEAAVRG